LPRIGLLSDSHGRFNTTRQGVAVLLAQGVDLLLHLGDVGTVEVIDALVVNRPGSDEQIEAHLVFGNTDWDADSLDTYARGLGVTVDHPAGRLTVEGGGELVFCHGHEWPVMAEALAQEVRYLCHGHTHRPLDTRRGRTRIVNPGALFRAESYTVAVLDTAADRVEFYPIAEP
jgi:putative phosphoesterase